MSLISWEPLLGFDNIFDEDFSRFPLLKNGWDLATDVYEEGGNVIAEMSLPGVDPDHLNVSVREGSLYVSGSREEAKEEKKKDYYRKEIKRGRFERIARLPAEVHADKAVATYHNGVLKILLPKKNGTPSSQVTIKVTKK